MRAVVVYESMSRSTRELAEAIASGLRPTLDVRLSRADEVGTAAAGTVDLLVAGGPTHRRTTSPAHSRQDAVPLWTDRVQGLRLDEPERTAGRRDWFDELDGVPALFAAFDTRTDISRMPTGSASVRIGRELRRRGSTPVVPPESFLVTIAEPKPGEDARARRWGEQVADAARRAWHHTSSETMT